MLRRALVAYFITFVLSNFSRQIIGQRNSNQLIKEGCVDDNLRLRVEFEKHLFQHPELSKEEIKERREKFQEDMRQDKHCGGSLADIDPTRQPAGSHMMKPEFNKPSPNVYPTKPLVRRAPIHANSNNPSKKVPEPSTFESKIEIPFKESISEKHVETERTIDGNSKLVNEPRKNKLLLAQSVSQQNRGGFSIDQKISPFRRFPGRKVPQKRNISTNRTDFRPISSAHGYLRGSRYRAYVRAKENV